MANAIAWGTQATMDYTCRVNESELVMILDELAARPELDEGAKKKLGTLAELVRTGKLETDQEAVTDGNSLERLLTAIQGGQLQKLKRETIQESAGGSPFISAWACGALAYAVDTHDLPDVYFVGLMPDNVRDYLRRTDCYLVNMHLHALPIAKKPATLSFELGHRKVMISCGDGRALYEMDSGKYIESLQHIARTHPGERVVVALGGLNKGKPQEYQNLIAQARAALGMNAIVFVGTNSFKNKSAQDIRDYCGVLDMADIVSMNESELESLYSAKCGPDKATLAQKLRRLPHRGIKICHAAEGAILDLNFVPQKIFDVVNAHDPAAFLEESIRLAADGVGCYIEHLARPNRYPNLSAVRNYSSHVYSRQEDGARQRFDYSAPQSIRQNGMVYTVAPLITEPLSAITGAGAYFDGVLLALLMRKHSHDHR